MSRVVLLVCGGISAYKVPNLIRLLVKQACDVHVIMSQAALSFVSPMVCESLSGNPVLTDADFMRADIPHLAIVRDIQLMMVVPATANFLAKAACGMADDVGSAAFLACRAPKLIVPAMHTEMFENPITQRNISVLEDVGVSLLAPVTGDLACGDYGLGRMIDEHWIVRKVRVLMRGIDGWAGKRVLITGGGTQEPIDDVRVLTNRSTGLFARMIAYALAMAGATVTFIGPKDAWGDGTVIKWLPAADFSSMHEQVMAELPDHDSLFMAAAVSDFSARSVSGKIKKGAIAGLELTVNADILSEACARFRDQKQIVGFCCESESVVESARKKLNEKGCHYMVANHVGNIGNDHRSFSLLGPTGDEVLNVDDQPVFDAALDLIDAVSV